MKVFIFAFVISLAVMAQPKLAKPFEYIPVDDEFWDSVKKNREANDFKSILAAAEEKEAYLKKESSEKNEMRLVQGIGFLHADMNFAASVLFSELITTQPGTNVALQALIETENIIKKGIYDHSLLVGENILDQEYYSLPEPQSSFVAYQNWYFNWTKGLDAWAEKNRQNIKPENFWQLQIQYLEALEDVNKSRVDVAIEKFRNITKDQNASEYLKRKSTHQEARLLFEKGDYAEAYKIFKGLQLDVRETGVILLERAWSKYYLKEYSKSLGLLSALEAPIFDASRSPEAYILKMLIYKDLCYYDAAFEVANEFNQRFNRSIEVIKRRLDLRKDPVLVKMASLKPKILQNVNLLNQLKQERIKLKDFSSYTVTKSLRRYYDLKIKQLIDQLDYQMGKEIRNTAESLLDWRDQVSFLDYQTRIDSLRVTKLQGEIIYRPEEIPHMTFDRIYWLFSGEYWLDELENLRVFVESRCQANRGSP